MTGSNRSHTASKNSLGLTLNTSNPYGSYIYPIGLGYSLSNGLFGCKGWHFKNISIAVLAQGVGFFADFWLDSQSFHLAPPLFCPPVDESSHCAKYSSAGLVSTSLSAF